MDRAYSILNIKAVDEGARVITGVATSPEPDRLGDVVEPLGVKFKNPMPLLLYHQTDKPVGNAKFHKPTKDGITFEAKIEKVDEPPSLKDRVDEAWESVKRKLVTGVSIGFRPLEYSRLEGGGLRFIETEVLELSLVTVPANADCTIDNIKSIDTAELAAPGRKLNGGGREHPPGASGSKPLPKAKGVPLMATKTIAEQISAFEATRQAKAARMEELMNGAAEKGETLDEAQEQEYDGLAAEVKSVDAHLNRLATMEKANKDAAKPIEKADDIKSGADQRDHIRVTVKKPEVPKGTAFVRHIWCKTHAYINQKNPADVAKQQPWHDQTPEVEMVLRTAVAAGTTTHATWAAPLVEFQNMASEFAELLRPATIIGRIPGLRRVPFNIKIPRETTGASVNWVGEGKVKPVSAMAFDQITLGFTKVAGIVPVTEELFRFSSPAVEEIIRNSLRDAVAYLTDRDFLDPTKAEAVGVSPASITNGVTAISATGTTADALRADLGSLLTAYAAVNMGMAGLVLVMTSQMAIRISLMRNTLGQREFEGLGPNGGTLEGIPVIVSENIVATGGSPANGSLIVAINAPEILLADDGDVTLDISREASLQMDTAPDSPTVAGTVMVSLWQHNMVALKAERFINWKKRRAEAVQFIQYAKYA